MLQRNTAAAVDMLRDDAAAAELRGQRALDSVRADLMAAIARVSTDFAEYEKAHANEHMAARTENAVEHASFKSFIQHAELDQARRDGMLGIVRYSVTLIGQNWRGIAALGAVIFAMTGNVHISLGVTP